LQIEASQNEIKSKYEDGYKEYLELLHGGVPKEEALEIRQLESFASSVKQLDLKSDNDDAIQARKDLLTLNYRLTTKWPDEKIQKYVDKIYNEGSDIDEIDEALGNVESYISEEKQNALNLAKEMLIRM
jgi:hypothetical protein